MLVTSKTHSKIFLSRMFDSVAVPRNNSTSAWKPANVSLAAARRTSMAPVLKDQTCMAPLLNEGHCSRNKNIYFSASKCVSQFHSPCVIQSGGTNFTFFWLLAVVQKFAQFLALCLGTRWLSIHCCIKVHKASLYFCQGLEICKIEGKHTRRNREECLPFSPLRSLQCLSWTLVEPSAAGRLLQAPMIRRIRWLQPTQQMKTEVKTC